VSLLTSRFSAAHPQARVEIRSMTSRAIERALEAFEIDAGVTYLDNEPLEHVRKVHLYRERYVFLRGANSRGQRTARSPGRRPRRAGCACSARTCRIAASSTA
jgi:DNA-binding transcriptional LysR family regulator